MLLDMIITAPSVVFLVITVRKIILAAAIILLRVEGRFRGKTT
jgi:hypothetical protein